MSISKKALNNIFFFLGLITVVVMVFTFDISFSELWEKLGEAGFWLIPIIGIWAVVYFINALSWRCTINGCKSDDEHISLLRIYRLTITGYALNYATPVGGLGGEPYRIMELSKNISNEHATSSVILYAMMHIFSHFWFWFLSVILYLVLAAVGNLPLNGGIAIVLGIICAFCCLGFFVFFQGYKGGVVIRILRLIGKIPGLRGWSRRFIEKHSETLDNIDKQIAALHKQDKKAFYSSLILELLARVVQSAEVMFMLILFDIDGGGGFCGYTLVFLHSVLIMALTSLMANMLGFLPMQLGVQEGGFMASIDTLRICSATASSTTIGFFVSIICRVREILWIFVGIALMKIDGGESNCQKPQIERK